MAYRHWPFGQYSTSARGACSPRSRLLLLGQLRHVLPRLISAGARARETPPGAQPRARPEAIYERIHRQRGANGLRNLKTNWPQRHHDVAADAPHALYPMRLRVVESNNVTSPTCRRLRAATTSIGMCLSVEGYRITSTRLTPQLLLNLTDDPAAALRHPPFGARTLDRDDARNRDRSGRPQSGTQSSWSGPRRHLLGVVASQREGRDADVGAMGWHRPSGSSLSFCLS
jgi:hypothetical protein